MRLTRTMAVLSLVMSVSLLAGCSGDDDPDKSDPSASKASDTKSSDPGGQGDPGSVTKKCQATVTLTGAVSGEWDGKAEVRLNKNGPRAVYRSSNDQGMVTAYSEGKDFEPAVNVVVDDTTYSTTPGDATGLDIGVKGKAAEIDADAFDVEENAVHVTASFDC